MIILKRSFILIFSSFLLISAFTANALESELIKKSAEELIQLIGKSTPPDIRDEIARRLLILETEEREQLVIQLLDCIDNGRIESHRVACLSYLPYTKGDNRVKDLLISLLTNDPSWIIKEQVASMLPNISTDKKVIDALEKIAWQTEDTTRNVPWRRIKLTAISSLGRCGKPAAPVLMKMWEDNQFKKDGIMIPQALANTGDIRAVDILISLLNTEKGSLKINSSATAIIQALGGSGKILVLKKTLSEKEEDTLNKVKETLKRGLDSSNHYEVRAIAIESITWMTKKKDEATISVIKAEIEGLNEKDQSKIQWILDNKLIE